GTAPAFHTRGIPHRGVLASRGLEQAHADTGNGSPGSRSGIAAGHRDTSADGIAAAAIDLCIHLGGQGAAGAGSALWPANGGIAPPSRAQFRNSHGRSAVVAVLHRWACWRAACALVVE